MNLCVTLVIYRESLHDARSTKYKKKKLLLGVCLLRHRSVTSGVITKPRLTAL